MKILKIILKILMLILTAIWGLGCGVLFPAFILAAGSEIVHEAIASDPVIVVWLITAVVGYVIPAALVMCHFYKAAAGMSLAGFAGILFVYARFAVIYAGVEENIGPTELYLPCVLITILVIIIAVLENLDKIKAWLEKKSAQKEEIAPSIFSSENEQSKK